MTPKPESTQSIRRMALIVTVGLWFACTLMTWQLGFALPRSALVSAVSALVAWILYHAIGRQNNGVITIALGLSGALSSKARLDLPLTDDLIRRAKLGLFLALYFVMVGIMVRVWSTRKAKLTPVPLWDEEIDRRSTG